MITAAIAVRAAVILGCALVAMALLRRRPAASRHAVLAAAFITVLLLPLSRLAVWPSAPAGVRATRAAAEAATMRVLDVADDHTDPSNVARVAEAIPTLWWIGFAVCALRLSAAHVAASRLSRGNVAAPVTVGLLRPRIVLPLGFETWPAEERQAALQHERAHLARHDTRLQFATDLACCLYWFQPLAWIAARRMRLECERACDDAVVGAGHDSVSYAALLVRLARAATGNAGAAMAMARTPDLAQRVRRLLSNDARPHGGRRALLIVAFLAAAIPAAALVPSTAIDPYFDPLSERVPGSREAVPAVAGGEDALLIAAMQQAAMKTPTWRGDLVADRARWALAQVENGRLVEPLIRALGDRDWRVRGYAAWALGVARDRRATEALTPLLRAPVWRLRAAAASALNEIGDRNAAAAMASALHDDAWQVRVEATAYFAALGDLQTVASMRNDPHAAVRMTVQQALQN